ncbi:hypothetical protein TRSC58_07229 [Trypanosoma rangeli SC58]|uniref:Uncharacterized protein n=1 Tax=Trypanosoma rangeli SC58 TaxID=429131 RepID=A0A061ITN7_TRYRA|nr:hypothetical protein TRSC58_07229 [Trypanosoma rangeli SC58]
MSRRSNWGVTHTHTCRTKKKNNVNNYFFFLEWAGSPSNKKKTVGPVNAQHLQPHCTRQARALLLRSPHLFASPRVYYVFFLRILSLIGPRVFCLYSTSPTYLRPVLPTVSTWPTRPPTYSRPPLPPWISKRSPLNNSGPTVRVTVQKGTKSSQMKAATKPSFLPPPPPNLFRSFFPRGQRTTEKKNSRCCASSSPPHHRLIREKDVKREKGMKLRDLRFSTKLHTKKRFDGHADGVADQTADDTINKHQSGGAIHADAG